MRVVTLVVAFVLAAGPLFAEDHPSIRASMERAAAAAAAEQSQIRSDHKALLWSGIALGIAGATTAALGLTAFRVEDSSSGNAPKGSYQACVAKKASDPIYATSQCDALKGKNLKMLWGGAAVGALGAVMIVRSLDTSAELEPGTVRIVKRIRF